MSSRAPIRHASVLKTETTITLDAAAVRGLRARDISAKEAFTLVDSEGRFFRAALTSVKKGSGKARVYEQMSESTESPAHITLLCAVLNRQRMMVVMQKATELGVSCIIPVLSERSVPREGLDHQKASSWPKQVLRAARQCRRASLPEVREAVDLASVVEEACFTEADQRLYLDNESNAVRTLAGVERPRGTTKIAFAVGPEGGWSDDERALLVERGALALNLGARVVRAETAVMVGLTLLQQAYGDF
ncbi:MAG: 16S rRNA (uracil(1498)-N(3))-methyltransferase [Polyangiales bacterium]